MKKRETFFSSIQSNERISCLEIKQKKSHGLIKKEKEDESEMIQSAINEMFYFLVNGSIQ